MLVDIRHTVGFSQYDFVLVLSNAFSRSGGLSMRLRSHSGLTILCFVR